MAAYLYRYRFDVLDLNGRKLRPTTYVEANSYREIQEQRGAEMALARDQFGTDHNFFASRLVDGEHTERELHQIEANRTGWGWGAARRVG